MLNFSSLSRIPAAGAKGSLSKLLQNRNVDIELKRLGVKTAEQVRRELPCKVNRKTVDMRKEK